MGRAVALLLVVLIAIGAAGWYLQNRHSPAADHVAAQQPLPPPLEGQPIVRNEPVPAGDGSAPTRIPVPQQLDGSDNDVRTAAHDLAPALLAW
ncbi:conserved hypothetical protein, partial [Ricinus communis]